MNGFTSSAVIDLPRERRGNGRKRLRRPRLLARHVALRHRALFDGPQRLAGDAIEHEQETLFGRLRDGVDRACRRGAP